MAHSSDSKLNKGFVLKASMIVFIFLFGAKVLNFFKKIMIGNLFGVSSVADAYFAAAHFPYCVAIFFEGLIFLSLLPLFSEIRSKQGEKDSDQFIANMFYLVVGLTSLLAIVSWLLAPLVVSQLVPGFNAEEQNLTISLFRIMSLVVIFISLCSFFQALNSYFERYVVAASSGLSDTVIMIGLTFAFWKLWGIHAAAWGAVLGAATAFSLQFYFLHRHHPLVLSGVKIRKEWVQRILLFLVPLGTIWAFQQIPLVLINRFGSGMWTGTITALVIAQTLTTVPMGLVSHTVLIAIFPKLARHASEKEKSRDTFFQTLKASFLILIPMGIMISAFAKPIAFLFFSGEGILSESTYRIGVSLICFGWSIFVLYADLFMTQSLVAVRQVKPAIILCATRAVLNYAFCYYFSYLLDYRGVALSFSLALLVNFLFVFPIMLRTSVLSGRWSELFGHSLRVVLACVPIMIAGWFINQGDHLMWVETSSLRVVAGCLPLSIVLLGVYLFLLKLFQVREATEIFDRIKSLFQGQRRRESSQEITGVQPVEYVPHES